MTHWLGVLRRRWWVVVAVAVVVLALVVTTVVKTRTAEQPSDRVARAIVHPDPVPAGPIVTSIPPDCGLTLRTLTDLAPGTAGREVRNSPDSQTCTWDTRSASFGEGRELEVSVHKAHEETGPESRLALAVQDFASAIRSERGSGETTTDGLRPVTGLGAEAVTWRETDGSTGKARHLVIFRQGNVSAVVSYSGKSLGEGAGRDAALMAASDVARGMRLTVTTPKLGTAPDRAVTSVPKACDMLPAPIVREFAPGAEPNPDESSLFGDEENAEGGSCDWNYDLEVEVEAAGASSGTGEQVAARRYLQYYLSARSGRPDPDYDDSERYAAPLRGLGDEAFVSYERDSSSKGQVVVRVRNALVRVTVRASDAETLSRRDAMDGAYRAALAAARTIET